MNNKVLSAVNLQKSYGAKTVIRDVSLDIKQEFYLLSLAKEVDISTTLDKVLLEVEEVVLFLELLGLEQLLILL